MPANCRFAMALHVLAVIAYAGEAGVTSETMAGSVNTNPVTIRRLLGELRKAKIIVTQKGAGLGSKLTRPANKITLADVYRAVESGETFLFPGSRPNEKCPVGAHIQDALEAAFAKAQSAMENELKTKTLEDILRRIRRNTGVKKV